MIANALALLQALRVSAACFCNGKVRFGENDCKHICIHYLRCRRRPDLCMLGNTHMRVYLSVAFKGGCREIMDTAPTCLCMGKRERKQNKKQHRERQASGRDLASNGVLVRFRKASVLLMEAAPS